MIKQLIMFCLSCILLMMFIDCKKKNYDDKKLNEKKMLDQNKDEFFFEFVFCYSDLTLDRRTNKKSISINDQKKMK